MMIKKNLNDKRWRLEKMGVKIKEHNNASALLTQALTSEDVTTESSVQHRELRELDADALETYMLPMLKKHHTDKENYIRKKEKLAEIRKINPSYSNSPFPHAEKTRKCNYAEIFMSEYLQEVTDAKMLVYRLRYNTNPEQAMKGDDVLLFDLDKKRIIIGEAKFRTTPSKSTVSEIMDGLLRAKNNVVPISLGFVSDRLVGEGQKVLADRVDECELLAVKGDITFDYIGLIMGNKNTANSINKHTSADIQHLLMISVAMSEPDMAVKKAFDKMEEEYERI